MATIFLIDAAGKRYRVTTVESDALGPALRTQQAVLPSTLFKPASGADRDTLVQALQALDYSPRRVRVELAYHLEGEGVYQVIAEREDTQDELDAWVEAERRAMARRLKVRDPLEITVTISVKE